VDSTFLEAKQRQLGIQSEVPFILDGFKPVKEETANLVYFGSS